LPKSEAVYDLSGKFGASVDDAGALLRAARPRAARLGVCFHVGSQCLKAAAYGRALSLAAEVIAAAAVPVEIIDVGGGFPVSYPGVDPPPLTVYTSEIKAAVDRLGLAAKTLWAEPGRALVAGGGSLVVQVLSRRGNQLFINDGVYGCLNEAGMPGFRFPARWIRLDDLAGIGGSLAWFELFGPTCDSADRMRGPFLLPADIREGDWVELGQLGAYGACLQTRFNGFDRLRLVEVSDPPMLPTPGYPRVTIRMRGVTTGNAAARSNPWRGRRHPTPAGSKETLQGVGQGARAGVRQTAPKR
jgi:ornithine decarboxylase